MLKLIKESLPTVVNRMGISAENWALLSLVEQECATIGTSVQVTGFKNNKIYIEAESSAQLQDLTCKKKEILRRIQHSFPDQNKMIELKFFIKGMSRLTKKDRIYCSSAGMGLKK